MGAADAQHAGQGLQIVIAEVFPLDGAAAGGDEDQVGAPGQALLLAPVGIAEGHVVQAGPLQIDLQGGGEGQVPIGRADDDDVRPGHLPGGGEEGIVRLGDGPFLPLVGQGAGELGQVPGGQVPMDQLELRVGL